MQIPQTTYEQDSITRDLTNTKFSVYLKEILVMLQTSLMEPFVEVELLKYSTTNKRIYILGRPYVHTIHSMVYI